MLGLIEPATCGQNEKQSNEHWKNKYLRLLEEYNELLKSNNSN